MMDTARKAFGDFLRSRREKLEPHAIGLPTGGRRRTAWLRRQEVAELAGIGIDWYIRMEQGRAVRPSAATVDALARGLRLNEAEHAHLRALALPNIRPAFVRETVPNTVSRIVERLEQPAYVTGRRWDVLAWNDAACALFTHFGRVAEADRNILIFVLTDPDAQRVFGAAWAGQAARMVARFRGTHDLWAGDPAFTGLVRNLRERTPEFAGWWDAHEVGSSAGTGEKVLFHPGAGPLRYEYATFQVNDDPALRLTMYTPV
ncbi:helix-turn-helix transcriptional regulator [Lichenifustis flavocetrariae]|uniref:Helix-turn-helix transcriptional regulator n=1 Tax=Lichenifustis flavocetrariae TaxID=2949735 RepID=A0AA41Z1Z3_9HYPH|nr:helix-turn-helix transcriptional regulator [Lichenifustis flavocetrariae]MCW6512734.1 helix-turn-helix transcriptional regulator [Lichenifustis flavocetrariae]